MQTVTSNIARQTGALSTVSSPKMSSAAKNILQGDQSSGKSITLPEDTVNLSDEAILKNLESTGESRSPSIPVTLEEKQALFSSSFNSFNFSVYG